MNSDFLKKIEEKFYRKGRDKFSPGDTISVHTKIEEGDKTRTQIFKGVVIAIKGSGVRQTFTIRKISYGIGVEKIYPLHSPMIEKIVLDKKAKNRASKLYYLREKVGNKALQVKEGRGITADDLAEEVPVEGEVEEIKTEEPKDEAKTEEVAETSEEKPAEKEVVAEAKDEKVEEKEVEAAEAPKEEVKA